MYTELAAKKIIAEPNRCYFSENIAGGTDETTAKVEDCVQRSDHRVLHSCMYSRQAFFDRYAPVLPKLPELTPRNCLQPAVRWMTFKTQTYHAFPEQTLKPKVQLVYTAKQGQIPRSVEIDRRMHYFNSQNIADLFKDAGFEMWQLIPVHDLRKLLTIEERRDIFSMTFSNLPIQWFDDFDFGIMRPEDWLDLGNVNGARYPVPAMAILPNLVQSDPNENEKEIDRRNNIYKWTMVSVRDYDSAMSRWLVTDLDSEKSYQIPRLFMMFLAENPKLFVKRTQYAWNLRLNSEKHIKLNCILNCMNFRGFPVPKKRVLQQILRLIRPAMKIHRNFNVELAEDLENEIIFDYQRTMARIYLEVNIQRDSSQYTNIQLPENEDLYGNKKPFSDALNKIEDFENAYDWLRINTIFCLGAVILAMDHVIEESAIVSKMNFYTLSFSKTASLLDFYSVQEHTSTTTLTYINTFWIENVSALICMSIRSIGKGWFDLNESSWSIYLFSKMYRFMQLVKFRMQNALRDLVESSIRMFTNLLCRPCECFLHLSHEFEWCEDVIKSPFLPGTLHVFYMFLNINESGPFYSTDPDEFEPAMLKLFDEPIIESHIVHRIDSRVMTNLIYSNDLYLSSVGLLENVVANARSLLLLCYRTAKIPLKAYLAQYVKHTKFFLLDSKMYLRTFKSDNKSPQEYQDEISMHLRMKANLEVTLPCSIQIGPFLIQVEPLKVYLVTKRAELASRLLEMLTEKLKDETSLIVGEYMNIIKILSERPISIERIFEIHEWMETLPDTIAEFENQMKLKLFEYEILDYFWHVLPNEDFKIKWNALAGPFRCSKQMIVTREMFEEETERFQKQQIGDLATFDEKVEALNMSVSQFSSQFDTAKVTEIAIDIKKLWKTIVETSEIGRTLNRRQVLFELPEIDLNGIVQLQASFAPYKTLWVTAADFQKWEEAWFGNPLATIVPDSISLSVKEYKEALLMCVTEFAELQKVQDVALHFVRCIEAFEPKLEVLTWIKNPAWIVVHWQEFCKVTGLEIKVTPAMNFEYCMEKGIMKFYDEVRDISDGATRNRAKLEAEIEAAERAKREAEEEIERRKNSRRGRKLL